jgi:hypothetical protein
MEKPKLGQSLGGGGIVKLENGSPEYMGSIGRANDKVTIQNY